MLKRLQKEIAKLARSPPEGVICYPVNEDITNLIAEIEPLQGTPYENGLFKLSILCGERYPNEPPNARFITPIYHPNIDSEGSRLIFCEEVFLSRFKGRICLNLLKMPPKGVWTPSYDICAVLNGIQILLAQPNPDDPLMTDITEEYVQNYDKFLKKAKDATKKFAIKEDATKSKQEKIEQKSFNEVIELELSQKKDQTPSHKRNLHEPQSPETVSSEEEEIFSKLVVKKVKL